MFNFFSAKFLKKPKSVVLPLGAWGKYGGIPPLFSIPGISKSRKKINFVFWKILEEMAKQEMFKGASSIIFKRAEQLRDRMTEAECLLWQELRNKKFPVKFRRQHPLGIYILDFYCHKLKLVIELDGNIHLKPEVKAYDIIREKEIRALGLTIIRFKNEEVIYNMEGVLSKISNLVDAFLSNNKD